MKRVPFLKIYAENGATDTEKYLIRLQFREILKIFISKVLKPPERRKSLVLNKVKNSQISPSP